MPACLPYSTRPRSCEFSSLLFRAVRSTAPPRIKEQSIARLITLVKVSLILVSILMLFLPLRVLSKSYSWPPLAHDRRSIRLVSTQPPDCSSLRVSTAHGLLHLFLSTNPSLAPPNHQTSCSDRVARPMISEWDPIAILCCQSLVITDLLANSISVARH